MKRYRLKRSARHSAIKTHDKPALLAAIPEAAHFITSNAETVSTTIEKSAETTTVLVTTESLPSSPAPAHLPEDVAEIKTAQEKLLPTYSI